MIKNITSIDNKIVKEAYQLKNIKNIKKYKKFLIEGEHLLSMSKDQLFCVFSDKILNLDEKVDQYIVNEKILKKLSSNVTHSNIIGVCKIKETKIDYENLLIYLDNIQDPGNLGTILRTCLGFNIRNIILSDDCCFPYSFKVVQSSQGAIFHLNLAEKSYVFLKELKEKGYMIYSTSLANDSESINNLKIDGKTVLVFGNEGQGIRKEILEISDKKIIIPIENIDSFNVGIATGIVLYKLTRLDK